MQLNGNPSPADDSMRNPTLSSASIFIATQIHPTPKNKSRIAELHGLASHAFLGVGSDEAILELTAEGEEGGKRGRFSLRVHEVCRISLHYPSLVPFVCSLICESRQASSISG